MTEPLRLISSTDTTVTLPSNVEAEAALLGAIMIDNALFGTAAACVKPEDFFEGCHGEIYRLIKREIEGGRLASPVTLRPAMEQFPWAKDLGGPGYLAKLTSNGAALLGVKEFAQQVSSLAKRRRFMLAMQAGMQAAGDMLDGYEDLDTIVASIDGALSEALGRDEVENKKSVGVARAWDQTMGHLDDVAAGRADPGLKIDGQLQDWNDGLGAMHRGDLIVLAGRPAMGKTALACSVSRCAALAGLNTDVYELEMSVAQMLPRIISDHCYDDGAGFTFKQLMAGRLNNYERERINQARAHLDDMPLHIHERGAMTVGQLIMDMRRRKRILAAKGKTLDVVVVDYLQLLKPDRDRGNKVQEITEMTRDLKLAAKELGIALVLLSQLSRAVEQREDKRPQLSDLRDSGSIEQDADVVVFVYREEYYLEAAEPPAGDKKREDWEHRYQLSRDKVELIFRKVRHAKTSTRQCRYWMAHQAIRGSKYEGGYR
ncbi:MAG: DnaB-like helicase C-terminal domain-containing protein [Pseudomonadota bacterium]